MKKVNRLILLLVAFSLVFSTTLALASGGPAGGGWYSGQVIQNIGSGVADVSVTAYDSTSASTYSRDYTIDPGTSIVFFSGDITGLPEGFLGSSIVSSDEPIRAIVNVTNRLSGSYGIAGGTAAAQYDGRDSSGTDTTVSFPLAKSAFGPKTTAFYIQNAGSSAATFTATFLMASSINVPPTDTYVYDSPSIGPGQMAVIIPADAGAPSGKIGSLSVTSSEPLAGTVLEYETSTAPALILQGTTGFTSAEYSTSIYFPIVKKQLGSRSTGLQVQNVSGGDVDVTVTYYGAGGSCPAPNTYTEAVRTLANNQSTTYLDSALLPSGCLATAKAVATGNIAAVVNESYLPLPPGTNQRATTYAAFSGSNATTTLVAPLFKEDLGGKRSGIQVQNTTGVAATATVTFKVGASTYVYNNLAIPANGGALLFDMTNSTAYPDGNWTGGAGGRLPDGSLAAVTVVATQAIVAVVNEAPSPAGGVVQDNNNYEAFNLTP